MLVIPYPHLSLGPDYLYFMLCKVIQFNDLRIVRYLGHLSVPVSDKQIILNLNLLGVHRLQKLQFRLYILKRKSLQLWVLCSLRRLGLWPWRLLLKPEIKLILL